MFPSYGQKAELHFKYFPFPVENANWNIYLISGCNNDASADTFLLRYTLSGDTVIQDIQYKRLCIETGDTLSPLTKPIGGIREADRKVYYIGEDFMGNSHEEEMLLYDFTASVGDTIIHDTVSRFYSVVEDIDSILIGEEYRKRYRVDNNSPYHNPDYVIEGIGSVVNGLLGHITEIPTCGEHYWEHICFRENDTVKYVNPAFGECYPARLLTAVQNFDGDRNVYIYPNPVERELIIENNSNETDLSFKIINMFGVMIIKDKLNGNKNIVPFISGPGVYSVIITNKEGVIIKSVKILK